MIIRIAMSAAEFAGMEMVHIPSGHPFGGIGDVVLFTGFYVGIAADGANTVFLTSGYAALVGLCEEDFITAGTVL